MSDCKRCDQCGTVFDLNGTEGLHVSRMTTPDGYVFLTDAQADSWDVCSWGCLLALADAQQPQLPHPHKPAHRNRRLLFGKVRFSGC